MKTYDITVRECQKPGTQHTYTVTAKNLFEAEKAAQNLYLNDHDVHRYTNVETLIITPQ